jgi:hypothetical protein
MLLRKGQMPLRLDLFVPCHFPPQLIEVEFELSSLPSDVLRKTFVLLSKMSSQPFPAFAPISACAGTWIQKAEASRVWNRFQCQIDKC